MNNKSLYIDVHVLQNVPPSCINRDDTGSPKTARYGGARRARVSSQAWKKAVRDEFARTLDEQKLGKRTKHAPQLVADAITSIDPSMDGETALSLGVDAVKATGISVKNGETGYLLFISALQAQALARLAVEAHNNGQKIEAKSAKSILNAKERPELNAIDVALFGRMVADAPILNVDAAVQVAHAIGIEPAEQEFDYFTAMDDLSPEDTAGAGMIGTVEYLSSTLYRYATLDVCHLRDNLGSVEVAKDAIEAFLRAYVTSMPTGKQNTFANRTLPAAVIFQLRDTQPVSLVGAFERPVFATADKSATEVACGRIAQQELAIDKAFGVKPIATYTVCGAPNIDVSLDVLEAQTGSLNDSVSAIAAEAIDCLIGMSQDN